MGLYFVDQFTYLHFAVGIIMYYWGISIEKWFIIHTIFELLENTEIGLNIINKYIIFWPGKKPQLDSIINIIGDTIGGLLGWLSAYYLDQLCNKYGWYPLHIKNK